MILGIRNFRSKIGASKIINNTITKIGIGSVKGKVNPFNSIIIDTNTRLLGIAVKIIKYCRGVIEIVSNVGGLLFR